jgi:hypothetical protein
MTRRSIVLVALAALTLAGTGSAWAQADRNVEIAAGVHYPLVSQDFDISQNLGYQLRGGIELKNAWWGYLVAEFLPTEDDLGDDLSVDRTLYGLGVRYEDDGEEGLRLFAQFGLGLGKLSYEGPAPSGLTQDTDLNYWYELGGGLIIGKNERWKYRFGVVYRRLSPDQRSVLLRSSQSEIVPSFEVGFRF